MKTTISIITMLCFIGLFQQAGQAQIVWKGGTPGEENQWATPDNWSQHRVPGAEDIVVIPNTAGAYDPVINQASPPIYYLQILGGAALHIDTQGILVIDGGTSPEDGILLVGDLINEGEIRLRSHSPLQVAGHPENLYSPGQITYMTNEPQEQ